MLDRSRGRSQTKRDILVLQIGGWALGQQPHAVKIKLFRNQIISLGWIEMKVKRWGGKMKNKEWRQIIQEAKAHPEL
jgi:hypothetical protein